DSLSTLLIWLPSVMINLPGAIASKVKKKLKDHFNSQGNMLESSWVNPFDSVGPSTTYALSRGMSSISLKSAAITRAALVELRKYFEEAEKEIVDNMKIDVFTRFLSSSIYSDVYQEHQEAQQEKENKLYQEQIKQNRLNRSEASSQEST